MIEPTEILERLEGVRRSPSGWVARCPAHEDRSPSLGIAIGDANRVLLHCYAGCEVLDVVDAIGLTMKDLAGDAEISAPRVERPIVERPKPLPWDQQRMQALVDSAAARLHGAAGDHVAVRYAAERFGVTLADVHRLQLGYAFYGGTDRLVIPFRDGMNVARGMQARALDPAEKIRWMSPPSPTRGEWSRWGWFRGRDLDAPVLVTEGPGDALSAVALGYHAIAIRGASHASDASTQRTVRSLAANRQIVLCGDGDAAGQKFSAEFARGLEGSWVRVLSMPEGMDLTDLRRADPTGASKWIEERIGS